MGQVNVTEVDYFEFRRRLQLAADNKERIEQSERQKWQAYVKENGVREVVMKQFARRFEKGEHVILDIQDADWRGYYTFSTHDELVYKWGMIDD